MKQDAEQGGCAVPGPGPGPASAPRDRVGLVAGWLLAAAGLVWVFHDVHPREILRSARGLRADLVTLAILADVASYVAQGWRWSLLMPAGARLPVWRATQAVYAGLFTSEVMPLRAGEVVRAMIVARRTGRGIADVLPSMLVERLFDGTWTVLAVVAAAFVVPLPREILRAEEVGAALVVAGILIFAALVLRTRRVPGHAGARGFRGRLAGLADGIARTGHSMRSLGALLLSGVLLVLQALSFWLVMRAAGLDQPFLHGAIVFLVVHLGTALPNAPGNLGTYQFFTVLGLALFGVAKPVAGGFSVVVFVVLTVPLWLLGALAMGTSGISPDRGASR